MNLRLLKPILLLFVFSLSPVIFSQKLRGVYEYLAYPPKDSPFQSSQTAGGVLEFPIKLTKATIQLNWFHRLRYVVTNLDGSNPVIFKGKWTHSGTIITLKIRSADPLQLGNMEYVKLKSGNYIKWMDNSFEYFKKR